MFKIKDKGLKNIFLFALIAALSGMILSIKFIYPSFTNLLVKNTEEEAVQIAKHISQMIFHDVIDTSILTPIFLEGIEKSKTDFDIMKLKIFDASGMIIYSTDEEDIGHINERDYFNNNIAQGKIYTKMIRKNAQSLEDKKVSSDVVETYVPIMVNGTFIGALEIYYDITDKNIMLGSVLTTANILSTSLTVLFLSVIIAILVKLDRAISDRNKIIEENAVVEERRRLARELHDSVTQSLYSLSLFAETAWQCMKNKKHECLNEYLPEIKNIAQTSLKEMRHFLYCLRPSVLEEEGLINALQHRLEAVEQRSGMKGELIIKNIGDLTTLEEDGLYGMIQEALNNSLKHAGATEVKIFLNVENDWIEVAVSDNGIGFDPEEKLKNSGIGLGSIKERANKLGGALEIESSPGNGAKILIRIIRQKKSSHSLNESLTQNQ
jgi:signal transduction histidine kinase